MVSLLLLSYNIWLLPPLLIKGNLSLITKKMAEQKKRKKTSSILHTYNLAWTWHTQKPKQMNSTGKRSPQVSPLISIQKLQLCSIQAGKQLTWQRTVPYMLCHAGWTESELDKDKCGTEIVGWVIQARLTEAPVCFWELQETFVQSETDGGWTLWGKLHRDYCKLTSTVQPFTVPRIHGLRGRL